MAAKWLKFTRKSHATVPLPSQDSLADCKPIRRSDLFCSSPSFSRWMPSLVMLLWPRLMVSSDLITTYTTHSQLHILYQTVKYSTLCPAVLCCIVNTTTEQQAFNLRHKYWHYNATLHLLDGHSEERLSSAQPYLGRCYRTGSGKPLWRLLAASRATHWWCMPNNDDDNAITSSNFPKMLPNTSNITNVCNVPQNQTHWFLSCSKIFTSNCISKTIQTLRLTNVSLSISHNLTDSSNR